VTQQEQPKIADPHLGHILGRLTISQIWAIGAATIAFIAGTFSAGYIARGYLADSQLGNTNLLKTQNAQLKDKDVFLSLYMRHMFAKQAAYEELMANCHLDSNGIASSPPVAFQALSSPKVGATENALNAFVVEKWGKGFLAVNKGQELLAVAEFPDGTTWPLPDQLGVAAASK
jgi:hypothetical protein